MSGIFGLFNQDGAAVSRGELESMASLLERRGPDRTAHWREDFAGLGLTLLATTPELAFEPQPVRHAATGCVITADVRLDNRDELLSALGLRERAGTIGDAGLILEAYLAWGEDCLDRLLGDFAFVLWDPRQRKLLGARDHFGMRPFYYHHTPGRFFAFASEPKAILVLPQTPYRINEGRIADFLVTQLEGIDKTSTFFEEVYRLPPAHCVIVTPERMAIRRYWTLEPGEELHLPSNEAYAEAFLEVFTEAVATPPLRRLYRRLLGPVRLRRQLRRNIRESRIHPDFAVRGRLGERLRKLHAHGVDAAAVSYGEERARSIDHPYLTVGRERYDRVASAVAVEPRDPFLDRRVVAFCLGLPGEQKLADGWPKIVLRRAMAGRLPDAVRWRTGKEHLGWAFTSELIAKGKVDVDPPMAADRMLVAPYVRADRIRPTNQADIEDDHPETRGNGYDTDHLAAWLSIHKVQPQVPN